jgi:hypothetical protein
VLVHVLTSQGAQIPLVCVFVLEGPRWKPDVDAEVERVLRPRGRAPATPRNRARPREDDTTLALLRQQQEIMAQMVEQQRRTNTVIELLATRLVQVPEAEARAPTPPPIGVRPPTPAPPGHEVPEPPVDRVVPPRTPDRAPDPEAQPEVADWRRIALAMATSAAKAAGRRPTFAGLDTENPAEFLEEYERYSTDAQVPPEKKLSEAIRCLRQTAARWAKFHQGKWRSFQEFNVEFLATYWSVGRQLEVRARILSRHYDRTKGDSMVDFFMEQAIQLRTLTQPIPECVMVEDLMRLFPENISLLFKSEKPRGERSIQEALDFLERQSVLHPPKLQRPKEAPTPRAPPRRMVSSAAVGEAEGAQPFLGANINKSPIEKRQQDVDGRCFRPGKVSRTSMFPRIEFVPAGFAGDKYPCCPGFSILGTGGCIVAPLPVLSRDECAALYPKGRRTLRHLGWRPSTAGLNPDRPGLRAPLGLLFQDTLYRPETFRHDPLLLANALDQVANTPYEFTKRTSLLSHILISIHQEELLALLDSGSEVTCINEDQFAILSAKARILTLPVASTFIHCATGQQSSRIKFQAWMEFSLNGDITSSCVFLVVKNLIRPVILGMDWFSRVKGKLDFDANSLTFMSNNVSHAVPFHVDSFLRESDSPPTSSLLVSATFEPLRLDLSRTITPMEVLREKVDAIAPLSPSQKSQLFDVLVSHQTVFNELPVRTNEYVHVIKMHDATPFIKRAYPIAFSLRPEVENVIQQMLQLGVIKREASHFASPMAVVKKKDGSVRICLDARWINQQMVSDCEAPRPPEDLFHSFPSMRFMSAIDLRSSYWQIPLSAESTQYTAFLFNGQSYTYQVPRSGSSPSTTSMTF